MPNCVFCKLIRRQVVWMLSCSDAAVTLRQPLTRWWQKKKTTNQEEEDSQTEQKLLFSFFFLPQFIFEGRAQHGCNRVIHLEYANSWQCICLLVLDLPLGGRSPTQLRSLSAVCLKTPVILPHSATLRQSHFSTSHPPCVCLEAVWMRWGRLLWEERRLMQGTSDGEVWWASQRLVLLQQSWKLSLPRHLVSISLP